MRRSFITKTRKFENTKKDMKIFVLSYFRVFVIDFIFYRVAFS